MEASKQKVVFHPSKSYQQFFTDYRDWCRENGVKAFTHDQTTILKYLTALRSGYPTGSKPRSPSTLQVKLTAIKRHYELNGCKDWIDFKKLNSNFFKNFDTHPDPDAPAPPKPKMFSGKPGAK